jgi:hypothetical protein
MANTPVRLVPYADGPDFVVQYPTASKSFAQMYDAEIIMTGHGKTPTTPLKSYPVGMSLMTLNNTEGATAGWPASDWATVTTFRRDPTSSLGYQFWNRATGGASEQWVRNANSDTWGSWSCVVPQAQVFGSYQRTTNQTIANAVTANLQGTMIASEGGMTYNASTGEVTLLTNGIYLLSGWASFLANATGLRYCYWYRNTTRLVRTSGNPTSGAVCTVHSTKLARCNAGEKLTFQIYQNSGASLDLDGGNNSSGFDIYRLSY